MHSSVVCVSCDEFALLLLITRSNPSSHVTSISFGNSKFSDEKTIPSLRFKAGHRTAKTRSGSWRGNTALEKVILQHQPHCKTCRQSANIYKLVEKVWKSKCQLPQGFRAKRQRWKKCTHISKRRGTMASILKQRQTNNVDRFSGECHSSKATLEETKLINCSRFLYLWLRSRQQFFCLKVNFFH